MHEQNTAHVQNALFLYSSENAALLDELRQFSPEISITSEKIEVFQSADYVIDPEIRHLVVCASVGLIKAVMEAALKLDISLGILPLKEQKQLYHYLGLSADIENEIELALQKNQQAMDVIRCNDQIVLFNASMGRTPVETSAQKVGRLSLIKQFIFDLRGIRLIGFKFTMPDKKPIDTAASGCIIVTNNTDRFATRLIASDENALDGMISVLVAAPASVMGYLGFLYRVRPQHNPGDE
jgi:diacylglycerol kinase family enzyme